MEGLSVLLVMFLAGLSVRIKIMSTGGEGGMVTTNNEDLYFYAQLQRPRLNFAKVLETQGSSNTTFKWVHDGFGSNYRMTEMQAAIGLKQLSS